MNWKWCLRCDCNSTLPNFNEKLLQEVRGRIQHPNRNIGMYIAIMTNMFKRLTVPVDENTRIKIVMQNIAPFYQSQLRLITISSIDELLELRRKLEARRDAIEWFVPPSRNLNSLMEPDLAYVYVERTSEHSSSKPLRVDVVNICWNCKPVGHNARRCNAPKTRYCFKSGNANCTVKTCTK